MYFIETLCVFVYVGARKCEDCLQCYNRYNRIKYSMFALNPSDDQVIQLLSDDTDDDCQDEKALVDVFAGKNNSKSREFSYASDNHSINTDNFGFNSGTLRYSTQQTKTPSNKSLMSSMAISSKPYVQPIIHKSKLNNTHRNTMIILGDSPLK